MILNRIEYALMNNPLRGAILKRVEAGTLLRLGGPLNGGRALEIGCGDGVGVETILERFGADSVDAFDLDPRMAGRARRRLAPHGDRAIVWVGDASRMSVPDSIYQAVFDFGIIHHVPDWRGVLGEVWRVLKPGGRFYGEEVLKGFIDHPISRRIFAHPRQDRFDAPELIQELESVGFELMATEQRWGALGWFAARKPD